MILIISNAEHESSTDRVVDWLINEKAPFIRINSEDVIQKKIEIIINPADDTITIAGQVVALKSIKVVWYRRWYNYHRIPIIPTNKFERKLIHELSEEASSVLYYLAFVLADKLWLSNPFANRSHSKINALYQANLLGIRTPDTVITNKKSVLKAFYKKHKKAVITKPITDPYPFFDEKENNYKAYVEVLTREFIDTMPEEFFMSQFQERVAGEYEIRSFFLDGKFYSTAITNVSTVDIKLSVRRNEAVKMIAYQLPRDLELKLTKLMRILNLNSGSIDLIKTSNNEHVFLEVNPVGQFSGYGFPNNYYLEREIANWLISHSK